MQINFTFGGKVRLILNLHCFTCLFVTTESVILTFTFAYKPPVYYIFLTKNLSPS